MNARNWRACVKDGVAKSKPVYAAQIAVYQAYMEASVPGISAAPALFTAINKDTAELYHEQVPFDAELAQRMSDRGVRILRAIRLKAQKHSASPRTALDLLARIQKHTAHIGERTFNGTSKTTQEQLDLFEAMGLKKPA